MSKTSLIKNMVAGAGGGGKSGGGSGRAPVEARDSLRSIQYAKILDLVAEGEIDGVVDGLKSVYLDDTPVQNEDGSYNFAGVSWEQRVGQQAQTPINGFYASESEVPVGAEVTAASSVTRTISGANPNALRITVSVPSLTVQDTSTGDINGTSVQLAIDMQNNGGGFVPVPLVKQYVSTGFNINAQGAITSVASTNFNVTVAWNRKDPQQPQTCSFQLQYRLVGSGTWLVAKSHTFSKVDTPTAGFGIAGNTFNSTSAQQTKTFNVSLANGLYEFRVVKTNGSISRNYGIASTNDVGINFGGNVVIIEGEILQFVNTDTISGKTTSKYQRSYLIDLPAPGPWDIRVKRLTPDSASVALQNKTFWDSYTEIVDAKLSYPNSALQALRIDAKQFNAIPVRSYEAKGVLVSVPNNYNPLTRVYTGVWNGGFVQAWTNNPAWLFYDLVTNDRYGLGEFIADTLVDKWSLYAIAQYCDEMVDDGFGGFEPRFTASVYLQTQEEAFQVISNIASIFRGMVYWSSGSITANQDAPRDATAIFTQANVIDGAFSYNGSSARVRHTVALVAWNDPNDAYRQKIEYVEDAAGIVRYGVIKTEVVAIGCTSRGQAHRMGRWLLYSEQNETETITFRAAMDATFIGPGDVIKTHDTNRAGARFGGRLISATPSAITLDAPVTLQAGQSYEISCVLPSGEVETKAVTNTAGTHTVINLASNLSDTPINYAMWVISGTNVNLEQWRVISVAEVEKTQLEITALSYRNDKFDVVEKNLILQPLPTSLINVERPLPPSDLVVTESLYLAGLGVVGVKVLVSWSAASNATGYVLSYQKESEPIVTINNIETNAIDIAPIPEGLITFNVYAVDQLGRRSQSSTISQYIFGKIKPPLDIVDFTISKVGGVAQAAWQLVQDLDVLVGGNVVVRHSSLLTGATWQDGVILDVFSGNATSGPLPLVTGTYMAKAIDSSGNWSENMVSFVATEGLVTGFTTLATIIENPNFIGAKTNLVDVGDFLQISGITLVDSIADFDAVGALDTLGGLNSMGTYLFDGMIDLLTVGTRRYELDIEAFAFDAGDFIDNRTINIDDWQAVNGDVINDCDAIVYAATTDTDPLASPTWSEWVPFFVGDFTARAVKFKLELVSANNTHNMRVSTLRVDAKIPT